MILDKLANIERYKDYNPNVYKCLKWLVAQDFKKLEVGKFEIDGENARGGISEFEQNADYKDHNWESHKKYIDVWALLSDEPEYFGTRKIDGLTVCDPYDENKDMVYYNPTKEETTVRLEPGWFVILDTDDAHRGTCYTELGPTKAKKAVLKAKKI